MSASVLAITDSERLAAPFLYLRTPPSRKVSPDYPSDTIHFLTTVSRLPSPNIRTRLRSPRNPALHYEYPPKLQIIRWKRSCLSSNLLWDTQRPGLSQFIHFADRDPKFDQEIKTRLTWKSANIAVVPSENFMPNARDVGPGEGAGLVIRNEEIEVYSSKATVKESFVPV